MKRDRYPEFKKGPNGEKLCRGCGKPVPKGRQTWCSSECYNERCPREVINNVWRRDHGVCVICGRDTEYLKEAAHRIYQRNRRDTNRITRAILKANWPTDPYFRWWQADHIVPHSEGGECVLSNMRTLCVPCHKARTKHWHGERKKKRQAQIELALTP